MNRGVEICLRDMVYSTQRYYEPDHHEEDMCMTKRIREMIKTSMSYFKNGIVWVESCYALIMVIEVGDC